MKRHDFQKFRLFQVHSMIKFVQLSYQLQDYLLRIRYY